MMCLTFYLTEVSEAVSSSGFLPWDRMERL